MRSNNKRLSLYESESSIIREWIDWIDCWISWGSNTDHIDESVLACCDREKIECQTRRILSRYCSFIDKEGDKNGHFSGIT